jgi:hypothetical protein
MIQKTLQEIIGLNDQDTLVDVKMSVDDNKASPSELIAQLRKIILSDQNNLLTDFVDY